MLRIHRERELGYISDDAIDTPHCFTTRTGGVSAGAFSTLNLGVGGGDGEANVVENCRRACGLLDAQPEDTVFARQVHGDNVRAVTEADRGKGLFLERDYEADALVTDMPGIVPAY